MTSSSDDARDKMANDIFIKIVSQNLGNGIAHIAEETFKAELSKMMLQSLERGESLEKVLSCAEAMFPDAIGSIKKLIHERDRKRDAKNL